jgi:hypothetical protein
MDPARRAAAALVALAALSVCWRMRTARSVFVVLSLAAALVVALLGYQSLRTLLRAHASAGWPQVIGSVRSSELKRGCGRQRDSYEVEVHYGYSVDGLEYHSTRVAFSRGYCGAEAGAKELSQSFVPGKAVTVYVDPVAPARAVLLAGKADVLMYLQVGIALLTVIGMLLLLWRALTGRLRVSW